MLPWPGHGSLSISSLHMYTEYHSNRAMGIALYTNLVEHKGNACKNICVVNNPSYCDVLWPILNLSAVIAARNRHSLHAQYVCDMRPACSAATHMNHSISQRAGDVAMAYWSCDSLKVPGFVMRMSFVNGIFVYSVYGQTEFPFRKPFWNGIHYFPKRKRQFFETENHHPYNRPCLVLSSYCMFPFIPLGHYFLSSLSLHCFYPSPSISFLVLDIFPLLSRLIHYLSPFPPISLFLLLSIKAYLCLHFSLSVSSTSWLPSQPVRAWRRWCVVPACQSKWRLHRHDVTVSSQTQLSIAALHSQSRHLLAAKTASHTLTLETGSRHRTRKRKRERVSEVRLML